eukprot:scaffold374_cov282-Alexandrium_tamarense.AAC.8
MRSHPMANKFISHLHLLLLSKLSAFLLRQPPSSPPCTIAALVVISHDDFLEIVVVLPEARARAQETARPRPPNIIHYRHDLIPQPAASETPRPKASLQRDLLGGGERHVEVERTSQYLSSYLPPRFHFCIQFQRRELIREIGYIRLSLFGGGQNATSVSRSTEFLIPQRQRRRPSAADEEPSSAQPTTGSSSQAKASHR